MLFADRHRPADLPAALADRWAAMCEAEPAFRDPLLGPDFARLMGGVRPDAEVAVFRRGEAVVGFLPLHRRPGGLGRPIGGPFSDIQALVSDGPLDGAAALTAADLRAFSFTALSDPFASFGPASEAELSGAHVIAPEVPGEAWLETLRTGSPKRFKNWRRLESKLGREFGEPRLGTTRDPAVLRRLIEWKREQLHRSGFHDVFGPEWSRALMARALATDGNFSGLLLGLWAGERLIAGHFGVRIGSHYHPWIAAVDPELSAYSPGQVFFMRAIVAMPELGLTHYELATGHDHYKRAFSSDERPLRTVTARAAGAKAGRALWATLPLAGRVRRRLDTIAVSELTLAGRTRGLATAIARRALKPAQDESHG